MKEAIKVANTPRHHEAADSREVIKRHRSNEIFFGVVGPVGAGASRAAESLQRACEASGYVCRWIKASDLIRAWAETKGLEVPDQGQRRLEHVVQLQNLGDKMREADSAGVARAVLRRIAMHRATDTDQEYVEGQPVRPDERKRAYLIDSIRHPSEINLLRRTYANAFALVGVVCEESERKERILGKYFTNPERQRPEIQSRVDDFIKRDSDDAEKKHGQHVSDAFYAADFFVDNTRSDSTDKNRFLDEALGRLVSIISHDRIVRPTIEETAMHHAHSARVRSACLSRQVGAALVDVDGTVVATGVNEVPKAGGGVYGEDFSIGESSCDHRCAFREKRFCSSTQEQNKIIDELVATIPELNQSQAKPELIQRIRKTRLGQLIEFSRAVHAEMDALLSAGREGVSTVGTRLFVTTFPCHYCARHIVSAGVYEVQFIEPYPKSLATHLHDDAIEVDPAKWSPPRRPSVATDQGAEAEKPGLKELGKVLFHPFVGVAPRLYIRAFEKIRSLKDKVTGDFKVGDPEWGDEWGPFTAAYPELEAALSKQP